MQRDLSVVFHYEPAPTEQAMLAQLEGFTKTTRDWIKVMPGEIHRLPVYLTRGTSLSYQYSQPVTASQKHFVILLSMDPPLANARSL